MISIILPIYNMQDYIAECLESVIKQTYKSIEIICVNDFSMDNSMTIVKNYAKNDNRIRIINNEKNRGLGGARNAGIDAATGEYIVFCDTDDKMMPDMIENLYNCLLANDADMVFCDIILFDSNGFKKTCKPFHDITVSFNTIFYPQKSFFQFTDMWPSAWNKIYKKSIIDKYNIKYHENILYEDHTFYYEYLFSCNKVVYLPKYLYKYRINRNDSIMHDVSLRTFEIFNILEYIKEIFKNNLDSYWYNILMPKISIRLIWERYIIIKEKSKMKKEFIDKSNKFLSQFKQKDIFRYKDFFIDDNNEFLYTPVQKFLQKIFSIKYYKNYNIIYFCGIKIRKRSALRELYTRIDILQEQLIHLAGGSDDGNN